jgi:Arc/MetJ-type ribon-helix-helix transcriptional regulator
MARKQNPIRSVQITLSTTDALKSDLELLVKTGRYGKNEADVAERLITGAVRQALKDAAEHLAQRRELEALQEGAAPVRTGDAG